MPTCCVLECGNNDQKGFSLRPLPTDPTRKSLWIEKINRKDWNTSKKWFICEMHFSDDMWEKPRVDGKRKLKHNAVPTIFQPQTQENDTLSEIDVRNNETAPQETFMVNCEMETQLLTQLQTETKQKHKQEQSSNSILEQSLLYENMTKNDIIEKLEEANRKLRQANVILHRINKSRQIMKKHVRRLNNEKKKITEDHLKLKSLLKLNKIFNDDQIQALSSSNSPKVKWSNSTTMKALRLKFLCGSNGYQELLKQQIPFPSERTLRRRKENVNFQEGILYDVFDILQKQVSLFKDDRERDAVIAIDEMSLVPGKQFDPATQSHIGYTTIPDSFGKTQEATHALVVMLAGIFARWKQVVAYHFTPNGFDGYHLKPILETIISKAKSIGLMVHSITSDMGSINQAMWRAFGNISAAKHSIIVNSVPHPLVNNRKLFFFADGPHLLKNLRNCLQNNKVIELPAIFIQSHNLSSSTVKCEHLVELTEIQENLELKLTPKLEKSDITAGKFNKMKVSKAKHVLSTNVSSALNFLAEEQNKKEYNTTAAFINTVSKWFTLITSRSSKLALGKVPGNKIKEKQYEDSIQFLYSVIELFQNMEIGRHFKPVQRGVMITTQSIIELTEYLIIERDYKYVLTSRFTQDCVENLFSGIRAKHQIPNALQFKQDLKELCISHYIRPSKNSNYDQDDREFICNFLSKSKKIHYEPFPDISEPKTNIHLSNIQLNILYNIAGYIIHSIVKGNAVICNSCLDSVGCKNYTGIRYSRLVQLKCFKEKTLFFINEQVFECILKMEIIIRKYLPYLKNSKCNFNHFFFEKMQTIKCETIKSCHQLFRKIKKRFIGYRLRIACQKGRLKNIVHNSKTMAMHSVIK